MHGQQHRTALVVLFASTIVFASTPQGTFERTLTVSGPVDLEVLTRSGDVTVRAGSSGSVFIRGKIYIGNHWLSGNRDADVHEIEQHPPIRQEGNSIHIDYVNMHNISVDYEISVRRGVPIASWFWFTVILLLIPPAWTSVRRIGFESQRWRESDYGSALSKMSGGDD